MLPTNTLQMLKPKLVSWSFSLEKKPRAEFLVSEFSVNLFLSIGRGFLYEKCHYLVTADDETVPAEPSL
jgi:hypothetical protein